MRLTKHSKRIVATESPLSFHRARIAACNLLERNGAEGGIRIDTEFARMDAYPSQLQVLQVPHII